METMIVMKETIEQAMENLPEEETIDEAMERLVFLSKIEEGREDIRNGRTYTQAEVEEISKQWLK